MKATPALHRLSIVMLLFVCVWSSSAGAAPVQTGVEDFTVDFGDFTSKAQLTYPTGAPGGSPTVLLIHGGCTSDMDEDLIKPDGTVQSHVFKDIASYFAPRGIAVMRYNKHYVSSAT